MGYYISKGYSITFGYVTRWLAFVSVCVGVGQRIPFVCFGAKPTERA